VYKESREESHFVGLDTSIMPFGWQLMCSKALAISAARHEFRSLTATFAGFHSYGIILMLSGFREISCLLSELQISAETLPRIIGALHKVKALPSLLYVSIVNP
jgi:hypothetical protein